MMRRREFVRVVLLILIASWMVFPAFGTSDSLGVKAMAPVWMGAGDGFMLAKSRFFAEGFGLGSWNRRWFLGIPGQHIGSPILPWLLSLMTRIILVSQPDGMFAVWRGMVAVGVVGSVVGAWWFVRGLVSSSSKRSKASTSDVDTISTSEVFGDSTSEVSILPLIVSLFAILVPSVLVLFPQIWAVTGEFGLPSWMLFSPFFLGDGQRTIAFGLVLVAATMAWQLIQKWNLRRAVALSFLSAGIVLVDSTSLMSILLWIGTFLLVAGIRFELRRSSIIVLATRLLTVVLLGFLLTSFWFTPGYIWTFLGSPSLGGRPFTTVLITLSRQVLIFLPAILGLVAAKRWLKGATTMTLVGLSGMLVFGSLTAAAFVADPDFWTDYSRFGREIDVSVALAIGGYIGAGSLKRDSNRKRRVMGLVLGMLMIFVGMTFVVRRGVLLRGSMNLTETAEHRVGEELERVIMERCPGGAFTTSEVGNVFTGSAELTAEASEVSAPEIGTCPTRAYLSGSSAFWLNSWFDVAQVRGAGEMGTVNDWWPHGSYQIREGRGAELSQEWLTALGVDYLVVHAAASQEVFHDFRFPGKFEAMEGWQKAWDQQGDVVFIRQEPLGLARVADEEIATIGAPRKGDDLPTLRQYTEKLGEPAAFRWSGDREIEVGGDVGEGEGIRLAVAYSPFWKVAESSVPVEVVKDPLGMIMLRPSEVGEIAVRLRFTPWLDLIGGVLMSAGALYVLLKHPDLTEEISTAADRMLGRESELDRTAL